ncbi:MAG: hypothetical protein CME36_11235 [unclassified Hahellaceae]|nr:hypothetical protein [Hahellaceae bacterium]|tara:strand:+ start:54581 stop:55078 length:498 start_codon:yes stop_codon:yes gene_type:complete
MNYLISAILVGLGATVVMDLWVAVRGWLFGIAPPNYCFVGRWVAHMPQGRFRHQRIASATRKRGECAIGWTAHYLIGIAFAGLLIGFSGLEWIQRPTLAPALIIGIGTVLAPFLLMQPGMGAGLAASKMPNPAAARLQSLVTHSIFGLGLYASAWLAQPLLLKLN